MMERRNLGTQGLEVPCIGLGCMGMSWAYGSADEAEAIRTLHRALEIGVTFLDTAEIYGPFKNEELLGRSLRGRREQAILATKFGFSIIDGEIRGANSRPDNVKKACDGSLKRLQTDYIDLYYQHRVDPNVPIEETVGAMGELVQAGKVRFIGLSEAGPETIRRAHKTFPISALQSEYSLWERGLEERIIPTIRELKIGLVPYSPVGRGFLTGQIKSFEDLPADDYRRTDPRYQGENFKRNLELVKLVNDIARGKGATAAQIALAWVLHQGKDVVPIPGTKRVKYLEENAAASEVRLDKNDLDALNSLAERTAGARYDEQRLAMIER
jgi:aryl-alcohol dehydrogenase-like predicted oxidoreductase